MDIKCTFCGSDTVGGPPGEYFCRIGCLVKSNMKNKWLKMIEQLGEM